MDKFYFGFFGRAILSGRPIGHVKKKNGGAKPNCTSDQKTTRNTALGLAVFILNVFPSIVFAMRPL